MERAIEVILTGIIYVGLGFVVLLLVMLCLVRPFRRRRSQAGGYAAGAKGETDHDPVS